MTLHARLARLSTTLIVVAMSGCGTAFDISGAAPTSSTVGVTVTNSEPSSRPTLARQPTERELVVPEYLCEPIVIEDTTFASGRAEIAEAGESLMRTAAHAHELQRLGVPISLRLIGHTDKVPSQRAGGNQKLSEDRANAVKRFLVEHGVDPSIITTSGVAESQPIANGDNAASLAKNRRVEVHFDCPVQ